MLKNYTSTVPASRSVSHIEDMLVRHGATDIYKKYSPEKKLEAISFMLPVQGRKVPFKLPARVDNCEKVLRRAVRRPKPGTYDRIREQAERTAWKLVSDWVDVQMSLIELKQVDIMEVFLPYVYDVAKDQTFYEKLQVTNFNALQIPEVT